MYRICKKTCLKLHQQPKYKYNLMDRLWRRTTLTLINTDGQQLSEEEITFREDTTLKELITSLLAVQEGELETVNIQQKCGSSVLVTIKDTLQLAKDNGNYVITVKYKSLEPFDNSSFDSQESWSKNSQDELITMPELSKGKTSSPDEDLSKIYGAFAVRPPKVATFAGADIFC